ERQADEVADRVIQGRTAEDLLDRAARDGGSAGVQLALRDGLSAAQTGILDAADNAAAVAIMTTLYNLGFQLQGRDGRVVYRINGTWANAKQAAGQIGMALTARKDVGGDQDNPPKVLFTETINSVEVILRNFGSQEGIVATFQLTVGDVIWEFK